MRPGKAILRVVATTALAFVAASQTQAADIVPSAYRAAPATYPSGSLSPSSLQPTSFQPIAVESPIYTESAAVNGSCKSCSVGLNLLRRNSSMQLVTVNPGTCFGYYPTQWRKWEDACPSAHSGAVVVPGSRSDKPTLEKEGTVPPPRDVEPKKLKDTLPPPPSPPAPPSPLSPLRVYPAPVPAKSAIQYTPTSVAPLGRN